MKQKEVLKHQIQRGEWTGGGVARVRGAWVLCESLLGSLKQGREVALFAV